MTSRRQDWKAAVLGAAAFVWGGAHPVAAGADETFPPFMIGDGLYYVGGSEVAAYLISTDAGLLLIDGGYQTADPRVVASLRALGFEPSQVKLLLNTVPRRAGAAAEAGKAVLGPVTLFPHPAPGCIAWSFSIKVDGLTRQALVLCADGAARSAANLSGVPCELFLANRMSVFKGGEKRAAMKPGAPNPFIDPEGCKAYLETD